MKKYLLSIMFVFMCMLIVSAQNFPEVENIRILGEAYYNSNGDATKLTVTYDFVDDVDNNIETNATVVTWYSSPTNVSPVLSPVQQLTLADVSALRYEVTSADLGKYIYVSVKPVDDGTFNITGSEVVSVDAEAMLVKDAASLSVVDFKMPKNATYTPSDGDVSLDVYSENGGANGLAVYSNRSYIIYGDLDLTGVSSGFTLTIDESLIVYGKVITNNNVTIKTYSTAIFEIKSGVEAKNNSVITVDGVMNVTGDMSFEGNTKIDVYSSSTFSVDGDLDVGDGAAVVVGGTVDVTGDLDTGSGSNLTVWSGAGVAVGGDLLGDANILGSGLITVGGSVSPDITDVDGNGQIIVTPIELTYFTAVFNQNVVVMNWETASEENNDYFTIERSANGYDFEEIATIAGAGNSSIALGYRFTDNNPLSGTSYYRLRQTDYDGAFEVFDIVSVSNTPTQAVNKKVSIEMYDDLITFKLDQNRSNVTTEIFDVSGRLINTTTHAIGEQLQINTDFIPSGVYIIRLRDNAGLYHTEKVHLN